ncbi:AraC-type DNA-binding protein [Cnuella takakiae]|uniref:AraC-type DNA-binding protein n=1 Tax=Cnuella takakiae TaxID=1302690 RepID=A0A1M4YYV7_9BACT|nr:AraC family transcriptional regulator [Cnuella takakiae]OLY94393.1 AraC family transcriptional regulator [Cnuella takakiae]SHF10526.1 AraC-type DNA-binding protein [Cnuella takakiae]
MNQYFLRKECKELHAFPHIIEFAFKKISTIQFGSLTKAAHDFLRIYYVADGRFDWMIDNQHYILYPGDLALILPGQSFGGEKDLLDIGTVAWLHLGLQQLEPTGKMIMGKWSRLSDSECRSIGQILVLNNCPVLSKLKEAGTLMQHIQQEFAQQEIGYTTRINQLIEELFIVVARQLTRQNTSRRDFPQTFMKLEQTLRERLSHQWTVEEMAALVGLGNTAFSEKVKSYTGFSPLNYLINIRISEAIKLLKRPDVHVTDIALDVGFYSSQHFATTFKKLTGYTPSEFRKKNTTTPE